MEQLCQVILNTNSIKPSGSIYGLKHNLSFNPLTILTELNYAPKIARLDDTDFDDFDYHYEYAFDIPLKIDNHNQYYRVVKAIRKWLLNSYNRQEPLDFYEIDFLKSYFDITFKLTASKYRTNPVKPYVSLEPDTKLIPFHYSKYSLDTALNYNLSECDEFFYECYSMSDLVYCILHFLALNKYKINQCNHCGGFFATRTFKQKYCPRNSLYPKYEHLNCEQAIRNISQDFSRKYSSIYNNLLMNYTHEHLNRFYKEYQSAHEAFKKEPSVSNITACYDILLKKKWYTKDSIRIVGEK